MCLCSWQKRTSSSRPSNNTCTPPPENAPRADQNAPRLDPGVHLVSLLAWFAIKGLWLWYDQSPFALHPTYNQNPLYQGTLRLLSNYIQKKHSPAEWFCRGFSLLRPEKINSNSAKKCARWVKRVQERISCANRKKYVRIYPFQEQTYSCVFSHFPSK